MASKQQKKLPFMKFFPADWLADTRGASPLLKGFWIDVICDMWIQNQAHTLTNEPSAWCRKYGLTPDEFEAVLKENECLQLFTVNKSNQSVNITCRRNEKTSNRREYIRLAVKKHRGKGKCKSDVNKHIHILESEADNTPPLIPPQEGDSSPSKKPSRWSFKQAMAIPVPGALDIPEFRSAWELWLKHLQEKKKLPRETAIQAQLEKLSGWGAARGIAALKHSIAGNYQGIYEPDNQGGNNASTGADKQASERANGADGETKPEQWTFFSRKNGKGRGSEAEQGNLPDMPAAG